MQIESLLWDIVNLIVLINTYEKKGQNFEANDNFIYSAGVRTQEFSPLRLLSD